MKNLGVDPTLPDDLQKFGTLPKTSNFPFYAAKGLANNWRPDVSSYNNKTSAMRKIRALFKKVQAGTQPTLNVVAMGDSTLVGYNGSTYAYEDAVPRQIGRALGYMLNATYTNGIEQASKGQGQVGDTTVLTGGFASYVGSYPNFLTGYGTGTAIWTSTDPGTSVEFYYSNLSVSGFTYQIDGGSAVSVSTTGANPIGKITVGSLSHKRHTITINGVASNYVFIYGWRCWAPNITPQIQVHNMAIGGARANTANVPGLNWSDVTTGSGGGLGFSAPATWAAAGITPDIGIICIGGNDEYFSTSAAQTMQGIRNMRGYLPAGTPIVIIHSFMVSGANQSLQNDYGTAFFALADELDCLYIDWNEWVGDSAGYAADGAGADGTHPLRSEQYGFGRHVGSIMVGDVVPRTTRPTIQAINSTTTAAPDVWYLSDPTGASFTVTLPTNPPDGSTVIIENVATTGTNTVGYIRGGSVDTVEGSTVAATLAPGELNELTYMSAMNSWRNRRGLASATAGTMMRRDINSRAQVAAPAVAADVANKGYVDTAPSNAQFNFPGSLSLYTGQSRYYNDTGRAVTIGYIRASVGTAPTGAAVICDVNVNGTTIYGTQANRPTIAVSTNTTGKLTTGYSTTTIPDGGYLTIDIDQIGSTVAGADLTVMIGLQ